jgi:transposase
VIPIEETKRVDWNAIRAEYIGGGISQRKLAKKYGVSDTTLMKKANAEGWHKLREKAESKSTAQAQQKTAEAAADNAVIAADIKKRLLLRLSRIEQKYPFDATEVRTHEGKNTVIFKIRDLTAAFRELTEDITGASENNELLQSLLDIERRAGL